MIQRIPEILAPAGSMQSLYAALHAEADAVYFGGKTLSARAYAGNFDKAEMIEAVKLLHAQHAKAYCTLNTLIKNHELKQLSEIGDTLSVAKVDAVILQDMGAYLFFKTYFPNLTLHASTQMTVHSTMGAKYLHDLGFERVVLSRELNLKEVKEIMKEVPIEVETFVHGALCYCYSGQCQMSSAYGERSANRGKCAQPCRLPYQKGHQSGFFLSLKDQMTLHHLPELVRSGIHSFKIEGRMKNPEYVYTTVSLYKKYRDLALSGREYCVDQEDIRRMQEVFSRGESSEGYYFMRKSSAMVFPRQPKTSDLTNAKTLSSLSFVREKPVRKIRINLELFAIEAKPLLIKLYHDSIDLEIFGSMVEPAKNKATTEEDLKKPLLQVGETEFEIASVLCHVGEKVFVPLSEVKQLRREILEKASEKLRSSEDMTLKNLSKRNSSDITFPNKYERKKYAIPEVSVLVRTREQLRRAIASKADIIYLEYSFLSVEQIAEELRNVTKQQRFYFALPTIIRNAEWKKVETDFLWLKCQFEELGIKPGVLLRTTDYLDYFKKMRIEFVLDHSINIWNSLAYRWYRDEGATVLNLSNEISYLSRSHLGEFELTVYGKLATMQTANCLANIGYKNANPLCHSENPEGIDRISDRKGQDILYHRNCKTCSNTLFNPVPLYLVDRDTAYASCLRFELLDESAEDLGILFDQIAAIKKGEKILENPWSSFTRGHFAKEVE